jgi:hypothetical protein
VGLYDYSELMRVGLSVCIVGVIATLAGEAGAGTVAGKLELPPAPERGPVVAKGFLDRSENPLAEIKKLNLAPYYVVALEGEGKSSVAPAEVTWDLVGESFARPVIAVPVGAEVVIRNQTKVSRTIGAAEDHKLIVGPLNPKGSKSFRATEPAIYTVGDGDAPHLRGKIVVVATPYVTSLDDSGRFELTNVADGAYRLRVFYYNPGAEARGGKSDWVFTTDVTVVTRGRVSRVEVNGKLPAIDAAGAAAPTKPGRPERPERPERR